MRYDIFALINLLLGYNLIKSIANNYIIMLNIINLLLTNACDQCLNTNKGLFH